MDQAEDDEQVAHMLNVILCGRPEILYTAQKTALAKYFEVAEAEEDCRGNGKRNAAPDFAHNVYKVMPAGLNSWEEQFAELLDRDTQNIVHWWHRNLPNKSWSVQVLLDNGKGFYPDFVIGIEGRKTENGGLLADPKFQFEISQEEPKTYVAHPVYGRVLILTKQGEGQWMTVRYDEKRQKRLRTVNFGLPMLLDTNAQQGSPIVWVVVSIPLGRPQPLNPCSHCCPWSVVLLSSPLSALSVLNQALVAAGRVAPLPSHPRNQCTPW